MLYTSKGHIEFDSSKLITEYMPLVQKIASGIYKKINFTIELNELIQSGYLGLIDATSKYVKIDSAQFETYATTRIRGSILDELRKNDHLNQEERQLYKKIQAAIHKLSSNTNYKPIDLDISNYCNISLEEYYDLINKNNINYFVSLDNEIMAEDIPDDTKNLESQLQRKELLNQISSHIKELSDKEQLVMQLIYVEDLDSKEVALILNITPARVSQIHAQAILKLKSKLVINN